MFNRWREQGVSDQVLDGLQVQVLGVVAPQTVRESSMERFNSFKGRLF